MEEIFIGLGGNGEKQSLRLSRANRHRLISGATVTGKTVTLQTLAEQFSAAGAIGTALGGATLDRFARGLLGSLLR